MPITQYNLKQYLAETYGGTPVLQQQRKIENFFPLLQKDYGEAQDCTLTSITSIVYFLSKNKLSIQEIYNQVEKIAKKYLYKGTRGTPFLTMRKIFHEALKLYEMPQAYMGIGKDLGYNFATIRNQINKNNPIMLSMLTDGRDYYNNHSVTVFGYEIYKVKNKQIKMLCVYDNWITNIRYVDYNKMSAISTIHYSGNKKFNICNIFKTPNKGTS